MKVFNSYVFLLLLLLTGSVSTLSAQNRTVSGKVLDALQERLSGCLSSSMGLLREALLM